MEGTGDLQSYWDAELVKNQVQLLNNGDRTRERRRQIVARGPQTNIFRELTFDSKAGKVSISCLLGS